MSHNGFSVKIPDGCPSLVRVCTLSIARYWAIGTWRRYPWYINVYEDNPFCYFPSYIIEDLVKSVYPQSPIETEGFPSRRHCISHFEMLCPLFMSNRIENFELHIQRNKLHEANEIMKLVCYKADRLKSLKLSVIGTALTSDCRKVIKDNLKMLLSACENLQFLYTEIYFDLRMLHRLKNLHSIKFNVPSRIPTTILSNENRLRRIRHMYVTHMSYEFGSVSASEISFVVSNLPQLHFVQWDMTEPLEKIHGKEEVAQITRRYEIRRAYLLACNVKEVELLVKTCPKIVRLKLLLNTHDSRNIYAPLIKLDNIVNLSMISGLGTTMHTLKSTSELYRGGLLERDDSHRMTMNMTVVPILNYVKSHLLKVLKIKIGVKNLDLELLNSLCPNVQILCLNILSDVRPSRPLQKCFQNMKELCVSFSGDTFCRDNLMLLTSSLMLCKLEFFSAKHLTDDFLVVYLLQRNRMSNLEELNLTDCGLTEDGLLKILDHCPKLTEINFTSPHCSKECKQFEMKVRKRNPELEVTCLDPERFNHPSIDFLL